MEKDKYRELVPIPSFIEQANAYIEKKYKEAELLKDPNDKPGLRIADHKIWVGVMDMHVNHVYDILVANFAKKVAEHYDPIMDSLKNLERKQELFMDELVKLTIKEKEDVRKLESKIEEIIKRQASKETRLKALEKTKYNLDNLSRAGEIVMKLDKKLKLIIALTITGFAGGGVLLAGHLLGWW
jgi:hypothetical protein